MERRELLGLGEGPRRKHLFFLEQRQLLWRQVQQARDMLQKARLAEISRISYGVLAFPTTGEQEREDLSTWRPGRVYSPADGLRLIELRMRVARSEW